MVQWKLRMVLGGMLLSSIMPVRSEIDFTQIKGLYSLLRRKHHLSPLHGFAWWKAQHVEHLYRYGNPDDSTVALIKELFFLNPWDGCTFDCTVVPCKPATYFTPGTIGCIMQALETHAGDESSSALEESLTKTLQEKLHYNALCEKTKRDQKQLQKSYDAQLSAKQEYVIQYEHEKRAIVQKKKDTIAAKTEVEQKLNQLRQQKNVFKNKRPIPSESKEKMQHKEIEIREALNNFNNLKTEFNQSNTAGKKVDQQIQKNRVAIRTIENKIKNSALSSDALHKLVVLMCRALQESQLSYTPYTLHTILLAFLWKKAADKRDFIDYFSAALPRTALTEPRILDDNSAEQRQWLAGAYCLHSYADAAQAFSRITPKNEINDTVIKNNYEELIAALYAYNVFSSFFPPQAIPGWATYKEYRFATCGSTALRNFLDNMLYDEKAGAFDVSRFANSCTVHPKLEHFYKKHGAIENVQSQSARDAWVAVTSALQDEHENRSERIDYKTPPENGVCEIAARSGIANMMRVMQKLLGVKSINVIADRLQEKTDKKITVDFQPAADSTNFGVVTVTVDNKIFSWHFEPQHSYVIITPHYHTTNKAVDDFMQATVQQVERNPNDSYLHTIRSLYRDRQKIRGKLLAYVARNPELQPYITFWCLMLFDLKRDEEKIALFGTILHNKDLRDIPELISLLDRVHNGFFENKPTYYNGITDAILSSGVYQHKEYQYQKHFLKMVQKSVAKIRNKFPTAVPELISSIEKHKAEMFYSVIQNKM